MESTTNESLNKLRNFINHATEYVKSSEIDILVGVGVLVVLFILSVTFAKQKLSKLPPGPIGLPLLGYIPFMSSDVHLDFIKLGKKYGDVFSSSSKVELLAFVSKMGTTTNAYIIKFKDYIEYVLRQIKGSENEILAVAGVLTVVFILSVFFVRKKLSNLPPGPIGLPLVGYLPFLSSNVHLDLIELGKKYGDIFSLTLGTETVIVLNGANVIKEAFAKPEFLGRPPHGIMKWLSEHSPFFAREFHVWKEQRRFVVQTMKDLGLGRSRIEGEIEEEISNFLDDLKSYNGAPMDVKAPLSPSMSNNICALVFGKRYDYNDPDRLLLDSNLEVTSEQSAQAALPTFYPWLRHVPFVTKLLKLEKGLASMKVILDFFKKEIEKHRKTFNPAHIRDFIDGYLKEMDSKKNDTGTSFDENVFLATLMDLFGAGSETVRTSILWCIYTMAAYPEVQRKVQKEMIDVLGPDRRPEFLDQRNLPYTHAVILEITRWKTIVALNILRYTTGDSSVGGYHIPKNTIIMANLWAVHHDPKLWDDPDSFKPERFLSPDGTSVVKSGNYMPFSIGKRACPGEAMANMELFMYFTSILIKFDIKFPEGMTPTFDGTLTVTYILNPFKVRFIERK